MTRNLARAIAAVAGVREEHAPDPRLAVFDVGVEEEDGRLVLVGETSEPEAAEALHRRIATLDGGGEVIDRVERLPREGGGSPHALVTAAATPMLAGPLISEPAVSQTLLGHRLLVLREHGRWLHCRSDDGYLGWIHRGYVMRVEEREAREWEMGTEGEACLSLGARLRDRDGGVAARLPWGCRFVSRGGEGLLPNGVRGRLEGEWIPLTERAARFPPLGEAVVATAARWMAAPYLWGGATPHGVDCSGLALAVYRTHGVGLPRDSDLQAGAGEEVDPGRDFSSPRPGDLLFFAEEPGRISHVAISLGGSRIIHSSLGNGGVAVNDLTGGLGYEEELRGLFVCARRLLPSRPLGEA